MRIALFSEIFGKRYALHAVLRDIEEQGGVDTFWILGDLAAIGDAEGRTLERLDNKPATTIISSNTDRFLLTGTQPFSTPEWALVNANLFPDNHYVDIPYQWMDNIWKNYTP